jgi:anti-anti-sigma factor
LRLLVELFSTSCRKFAFWAPRGSLGSVGAVPTELNVSVTKDGGRAVINLSGELDMETRRELLACVAEQMAQGNRHVVLDLAEVTFIDSQGLAAFVLARDQVSVEFGTLRLRGLTRTATRLLEMSGLLDELDIQS